MGKLSKKIKKHNITNNTIIHNLQLIIPVTKTNSDSARIYICYEKENKKFHPLHVLYYGKLEFLTAIKDFLILRKILKEFNNEIIDNRKN